MKPQAKSKIFQTFQSSTPNRETSLQIRATEEVENSWRFSRVTARVGQHKEGVNGQNNVQARVWE